MKSDMKLSHFSITVLNSVLMTLFSSSAMAAIKMAGNTSPRHLAIFRSIISILIAMDKLKRDKKSPWPTSPNEKNVMIIRGILGVAFIAVLYIAVKLMDFQIVTALFMLNIPLTVIFMALLGKPSHILVYIASFFSFLGCIFVVAPDIFYDSIS